MPFTDYTVVENDAIEKYSEAVEELKADGAQSTKSPVTSDGQYDVKVCSQSVVTDVCSIALFFLR